MEQKLHLALSGDLSGQDAILCALNTVGDAWNAEYLTTYAEKL